MANVGGLPMLPDQDVDTVVWPGTSDAQAVGPAAYNGVDGADLDQAMMEVLAKVDPSVITSLTPRQATFVKGVLQGLNQTEAAREAGYKVPDRAGYKARQDEGVAQIIHAHRTSMFGAAKVQGGISLGQHLNRLGNLSHAAEQAGEFGAAITAETNRGKASGLYVHKTAAEQAADEAGAATSILKLRGMMERIAKRGGK